MSWLLDYPAQPCIVTADCRKNTDSKRKKPPGATLRCDGRLPTPSACLHIVKVFVGLQSHNAPVRDSGQRENRSCTAFADKFRVFSFDFIGLQPT